MSHGKSVQARAPSRKARAVPRIVARSWAFLRARVRSGRSWIVVGLLAATFALLLSSVTLERYAIFHTYALDLGNYNQAFYTTVVDHQYFLTTVNFATYWTGPIVAGHFSPVLFLMLPLYALAPGPQTLLVLQSIFLAQGAFPAFALAKARLGSDRWGLLFASLYLASPLTFSAGWFDFHPEVLLPFSVLSLLYFFERRRPVLFTAATLLALGVVETEAALLLLLFGFMALHLLWRRWRATSPAPDPWAWRLVLLGLVLCTAYLAFSFEVIRLYSQYGAAFGTTYSDDWAVLGASSVPNIPIRAILDPHATYLALTYALSPKLLYIALLLGSFAFLPFLGEIELLMPAVGWFGLIMLANFDGLYEIGDQYVCYTIPFLLAGTIAAVARLRGRGTWTWRRSWSLPRRRALAATSGLIARRRLRGQPLPLGTIVPLVALAACTIVVTSLAAPWTPDPIASFSGVGVGIPTPDLHTTLLTEVLALIPPQASVLTIPSVFSHVSDRANAYVVPTQGLYLNATAGQIDLQAYLQRSTYVLLDFSQDILSSALVLQDHQLSGFGLLAAADGIDLYERGWTGPLALWYPEVVHLPAGTLGPENAEVLGDGAELVHDPGSQNGTVMWRGPGVPQLAPGHYEVTFSLEMHPSGAGGQLVLSVFNDALRVSASPEGFGSGHAIGAYRYHVNEDSANDTEPATATVTATSSAPVELAWNLTEEFNWNGLGYFETEGYVLSSGMSLAVEGYTVQQLSPTG